MRRKKQKFVRRTLRFLKINFEFRPPFKILVDGNFIHVWEKLKRGDAKDHIHKLLGDDVRVFTTKCVMHELRSLGDEYKETRRVCRGYALHKCGHEGEVSAAECLFEQVKNGNRDHFFVATQDKSLQRLLTSTSGCALLFASVNGVHLEAPSDRQVKEVEKKVKSNLGPGRVELKDKTLQELKAEEEAARPKERSIFKKTKAKGPNPLSRLPKRKKLQPKDSNASGQKGGTEDGSSDLNPETMKRKRKRIRSKSTKESAGTQHVEYPLSSAPCPEEVSFS